MTLARARARARGSARAELSADEARTLALRAQGFGERDASPVEVLERLGAIQLDSVNVVVRSHELVPFSRAGAYSVEGLYDEIYRGRRGFEYWGHSASWLPIGDFRLYRHRVKQLREHGRGATTVNKSVRAAHRRLYREILRRVRDGPVTAADFAAPAGHRGTWWQWKPAKVVLEDLFDRGELMCAGRTASFARIYDLPERVLDPATDRRDPGVGNAVRALVLRSVTALGVATGAEAADYFRCQRWSAPWREALERLRRRREVVEVEVEGWREPGLVVPAALEGPLEPPAHRATFLSPLDNLLWHRPRTARMFSFEHTFEIYKRPERRRFGYYVMPLLAQGHLRGRADLKLDRAAGALRAHGVWLEGAAPEDMALALVDLAQHLGASSVDVQAIDSGRTALRALRKLVAEPS